MKLEDSRGRPVVVVTGMGIVTSLGIGKARNWEKLTAGESGIRQIDRFAIEGLRTQIFQRMRKFLEMMAAEPRVSATVLQTVGSKGYDGLALARVV